MPLKSGKSKKVISQNIMKREIGLPKTAPKAAKKADEKADKKAGIKEGSAADLRKDKQIMKRYKKY